MVLFGASEDQNRELRHPYLKYMWLIRSFVASTACLNVWICGITSIFWLRIPIAIYLLILGCPMLILEGGVLAKLVCGQGGPICQFFSFAHQLDYWMRGIPYIILSIPCFLSFMMIWGYSTGVGVLLIATGLLYCVKDMEWRPVNLPR